MLASVAASSLLIRAKRLRWWVVASALVVGSCVVGQRAFARGPAALATPALLSGVGFRDQGGAEFRVERLAGSSLLLNFVFTRCTSVCPTQTRELGQLRRALPDALRARVAFVTISLDPGYDSPGKLRHFSEQNGAGWPFLSASPEATRELLAQLQGVANRPALPEPEPAALPAGHGTALYLFDHQGRLMQRYVGAPIDQERLLADLARVDRVSQAALEHQPVARRDWSASP